MPLTVETGQSLPDADAFVSVADCDAYHLARGNTTWTGDDTAKEEAIRRATSLLDTGYQWKGYKLNGRIQRLAWPRSWVVDREGWPVSPEEVPREVVDACCEIALRELINPGSLTPDVVRADRQKRVKVGELEVEYESGSGSTSELRPTLSIVQDMLTGLVESGPTAQRLSGRATR